MPNPAEDAGHAELPNPAVHAEPAVPAVAAVHAAGPADGAV